MQKTTDDFDVGDDFDFDDDDDDDDFDVYDDELRKIFFVIRWRRQSRVVTDASQTIGDLKMCRRQI